jgi:hypothetical protein
MKKICLLLCILYVSELLAQPVSINTSGSTGDASSILDISSTNKGLLIPRLKTTQIAGITNPARGLLIYDSTVNQFKVNIGTSSSPNWQALGAASGWSITGNSGINSTSNFLGTLDNKPIKFRVNNLPSGSIDSTGANTAIGFKALDSLTAGLAITAFGYKALVANTSANESTAFGANALRHNTTGDGNVAVGSTTLYLNSTGTENTGVGTNALFYNSSGTENTGIGYSALFANTVGVSNTAVGLQSLYANSSGNHNIAIGTGALFSNTTGNENTSIGYQSLNNNTAGYSNVAVGIKALHLNIDKSNLVAVGDSALYSNGSGNPGPYNATFNTALGSKTLFANSTGYNNTATGTYALYTNSTGFENTANGASSLTSMTTGNDNTAMGSSSMLNCTTGSNNVGVGAHALENNTSGNFNTAVGISVMQSNTTGMGNTVIGAGSGVALDGLINATVIGFNAFVTASNKIVIGNNSVTSIGGYVGWTNFSDGRYKQNIKQDVPGLAFIRLLQPVTYTLDINGIEKKLNANRKEIKSGFSAYEDAILKQGQDEKSKIIYTGFVAQDVEKAALSIGYNFSGVDKPKDDQQSFYGLRYADFVVPLVKAVQEQQAIIEKQNQQIQELMKRLEKLEDKR